MFEREPEMFFRTDLKDKLNLTIDKTKHGNSMQISQSYYIECQLSAPSIVKRVQSILQICETDDDLMVKLK